MVKVPDFEARHKFCEWARSHPCSYPQREEKSGRTPIFKVVYLGVAPRYSPWQAPITSPVICSTELDSLASLADKNESEHF
jgi:hypothetical protein